MVFFRRSRQFALPKRHKQVQQVKESIEPLPIPQPTASNQNSSDEVQVFKIEDLSDKGKVYIVLSELNVFFTKMFLSSCTFDMELTKDLPHQLECL